MRNGNGGSLQSGGLDRAAELRADPALRAARVGASARVIALWRGQPLIEGFDVPRLVQLAPGHSFLREYGRTEVFLGREPDGGLLFATDVSSWEPVEENGLEPGSARPGFTQADVPLADQPDLAPDARFADLRAVLAALSPLEVELAATARGLFDWHRLHGFCAACGAASQLGDAGWRRDCPACGRQHFPRVDPVVIMLVRDGNRVLLGRGKGWPEGFYSLLAGYMEPGETIGAAVRREVFEEAGVRVGAVHLLSSQPWPFPAQLMIGCVAEAHSRAIRIDPAELDDALWLSREDLLEVFAGRHPRIRRPRSGAIAAHLLHLWLADRLD